VNVKVYDLVREARNRTRWRREMRLETEQTSVRADAVIAAWDARCNPPAERLQIATQIVVTKGGTFSRNRHARHLSATRKAWCERPDPFRRGATHRAQHRGRSHHGLLTVSDAVAF
jgi:hypothetical protein